MKRFWMVQLTTLLASTFVFTGALADANTTYSTGNSYTVTDPDFPDANPSEADYNQVGKPVQDGPDSLTFSNQDFNVFNPVKVSGTYSSAFGYELEAAYTRLLNSTNAISLLGSYSGQENRIDITWAHAWNARQRTKISVERLSQELDFDYDSGSVSEWVPQYAVGAGYQYLFDQGWLNAMELSGYYAQAESQDLDTVRFTGDDGYLYDNYRHIAGATSKGLAVTADVLPWQTAMLSLGLNYDEVAYDTKYEDTDAEDSKGLGFTLGLEQILSKHSKFELTASQRETYDTYSAKVSVLTPNNMELGVMTEATMGNDNTNENRYSVDFAYYIDDDSRYETGYSVGAAASSSSLASWAAESLAYMNLVLAAADQKTVRVVSVSDSNSDNELQSSEPTINLVAGSINTVSIANYLDSSNLTAEQTSAEPKIYGGPANVTFSYKQETKSLVTEQEVPEEDAGQESKPLVVLFPQNGAEAKVVSPVDAIKNKLKNSLVFKVMVDDGLTPYENPDVEKNYGVVTAVGNTQQLPTLFLENFSDPATLPQGTNVLFINPSNTYDELYATDRFGGYAGVYREGASGHDESDLDPCYSLPVFSGDGDQTMTFTNTVSSSCPDAATLKVKACNQRACSEELVIDISASRLAEPSVNGDEIQYGQTGTPYTKQLTTTEVSAGEDSNDNFATFDEDATTLTVMDGVTCEPVSQETSGLALQFNNNSGSDPSVQPTVTLTTNGANLPVSLANNPINQLKVYLTVVNSDGETANNGTESDISSCEGQPFILPIASPPTLSADIDLGSATLDGDAYSYSFASNSVMTTGSSNLDSDSPTAYSFNIIDSSNNLVAEDINLADLGLSLDITGTDITLSGTYTAAQYAGDKLQVIFNPLFNLGNSTVQPTPVPALSTDNNSAPAVLSLLVNPEQAPSVTGGSAVNAAETSNSYGLDANQQTSTYNFGTSVSAGSGRSYANISNSSSAAVSDQDTYVKVVDQAGTDVTSDAHVILSDNGNGTLNLISDGSVVSSSLASGTYNVYVHVINDAGVQASNCSQTSGDEPADCGDGYTGGTPFTMVITNTIPSVNGGSALTNQVITGAAYENTFSLSQVSAGGNQDFNDLNGSSDTSTFAKVTDSSGNVIPLEDLNLTLKSVTSGSQHQLQLTTDGASIPNTLSTQETYNVYVYVTNNTETPQNAMNCDSYGNCTADPITSGTPFTLTVSENSTENPVVTGGQVLPSTETNVPYEGSGTVLTVTAGQFNTITTDSITSGDTYVKALDSTGKDVTDKMGIELSVSGDGQTLSVVSKSGSVVSSDLASPPDYDVFVHVVNSSGFEASNCGDPQCSAPVYGSTDADTITVNNTSPIVGSGAIQAATTNVVYAGQTFSTSAAPQISSGAGNPGYQSTELFITNSNGGTADLSSQLHVALNDLGNGQLALQSDGTAVDTSLSTGTYNVYIKVTNNNGEVASNCAEQTCSDAGDAPFTMAFTNTVPAVDGEALPDEGSAGSGYSEALPNTSPGAAGIDGAVTTYANVVTTPPSSNVRGAVDNQTYVKVADLSGNDVTADFGMALQDPGASPDLTMYSNSISTDLRSGTYNVYIHVYNSAGEESSNCATSACNSAGDDPYILTLDNDLEDPQVGGGQTLTGTETNVVYSTTPQALTAVTAGQSNTYGNLNTASETGTYVTVLDSANNDVTADFGVQLASSGDTLQVVGDGSTKVSSSLPSGDYHVFVHVYNSPDGKQASNCSTADCSSMAYDTGTPDVITVTNTFPLVGGGAIQSAERNATYAGQTFSSSQVTAGDGATYQSTELFITKHGESTDVSSRLNVVLDDNGGAGPLALVSTGSVVDPTLSTGTYDVYIKVTNDNNEVASNCASETCNAAGDNPFTIDLSAGMETVTLTCPAASDPAVVTGDVTDPATGNPPQSTIKNSGGTTVAIQDFSSVIPDPVNVDGSRFLHVATLIQQNGGYVLQCQYNPAEKPVDGSATQVYTATMNGSSSELLPSDATGTGSFWNGSGTVCDLDAAGAVGSSCVVTYQRPIA